MESPAGILSILLKNYKKSPRSENLRLCYDYEIRMAEDR
jgi:hypothetical protein